MGADFLDDMEMPGMLHGVVVRSTLPHAWLQGVEQDSGFDWSNIVSVDVHDIPDVNYLAPFPADQPVLADEVCRHAGEPVHLLAAETRSRAMMARRRLKLRERSIAAVTDSGTVLEQERSGSHLEHCSRVLEKGGGEGFVGRVMVANPAVIQVEGCYRTGAQEHLYLEPQGVLARPTDDGGIEVWGSLQCPFFVAEALAGVLALPEERVRVVQCRTGRGFGGKQRWQPPNNRSILGRSGKQGVYVSYTRRPIPQALAICRLLRPWPHFRRSTSLIFRMDNLFAGIGPLPQWKRARIPVSYPA